MLKVLAVDPAALVAVIVKVFIPVKGSEYAPVIVQPVGTGVNVNPGPKKPGPNVNVVAPVTSKVIVPTSTPTEPI